MSGGDRGTRITRRLAHAAFTKLSALGDAVVCFRGQGNQLCSNVPRLHEREDCLADIWPENNPQSKPYLAASILVEFLIHHRDIDDNETIAEMLHYLVPSFTTEIMDLMPDQGGIIPIAVIGDWIDRQLRQSSLSLQLINDDASAESQFSWEEWPDLTTVPFTLHGLVSSRNDENQPLYNIQQRIWLRPLLRMDWQGNALARLTLAANIIDAYVWTCAPGRTVEIQFKGHIEDLYESFVEDFIQCMPGDGGHIPVAIIRSWMRRQA